MLWLSDAFVVVVGVAVPVGYSIVVGKKSNILIERNGPQICRILSESALLNGIIITVWRVPFRVLHGNGNGNGNTVQDRNHGLSVPS